MNEAKPIDPKDESTVYFDNNKCDDLNDEIIKNSGKLEAVTFPEPDRVQYKKLLLSAFKDIEDPFG